MITSEDGVNQDLGTETGYYNTSPSQLQYSRNTGGGSTQQTTPQTPNTPSSIPDIILTGERILFWYYRSAIGNYLE